MGRLTYKVNFKRQTAVAIFADNEIANVMTAQSLSKVYIEYGYDSIKIDSTGKIVRIPCEARLIARRMSSLSGQQVLVKKSAMMLD